MKLFQQLLVAPAALGLLPPLAATAADLNLEAMSKYASKEQVTSISQFGDVKPTDWAYQALSNLIDRYGCVAGYPNGTFDGGRTLARFEAAALLNACLDRVTEVTDEFKKLLAEFEKELAILKGRVDGLEAKVGELEATQFSTTTKLSGQATFVIGGVSNAPYSFGSGGEREKFGQLNGAAKIIFDSSPDAFNAKTRPINNIGDFYESTLARPGLWNLNALNQFQYNQPTSGDFPGLDFVVKPVGGNTAPTASGPYDLFFWKQVGKSQSSDGTQILKALTGVPFKAFPPGAVNGGMAVRVAALRPGDDVTFNYDVRLNFDTSFTGKDLLRTQLRSGNAGASAFGSGPSQLEVFADQCGGTSSSNGCSDIVNINRLFYQFPLGNSFKATVGAKVRQDDMLPMWPSAYPADSVLDYFTYAGAPAAYSLNLGAGFGLSWSQKGWNIGVNYVSDTLNAPDSSSGLGEGFTATAQLGYAGQAWGVAVAYTYGDNSDGGAGQLLGNGTSIANFLTSWPGSTTSSVGLSGYWTPTESKWIPSISAGFGYTDLNTNDFVLGDYDLWSWSVGLQWSDVFAKGNSLGLAVGMPTFVDDSSFNSPTALEIWYKFQVTDNISVTPALFWIQDGAYGASPIGGGSPKDSIGAVLKTTFRF